MQKITRIVTIYDQWKYLKLWLDNEALFEPDISWIIINDKPTIPIPESQKRLLIEKGILLIEPPVNQGRSGARNMGAALATTPWIDFVDGDDLPLPLHSEDLLSFTGKFEFLYFPHRLHVIQNDKVEISDEYDDEQVFELNRFMFRSLPPLNFRPASLLIDRRKFLEIGGYDGRFDSVEDYHFGMKADQAGWKFHNMRMAKQSYLTTNEQRIFQPSYTFNRLHFYETARQLAQENGRKHAETRVVHHAIHAYWQIVKTIAANAKTEPSSLELEHFDLNTLRGNFPSMISNLIKLGKDNKLLPLKEKLRTCLKLWK